MSKHCPECGATIPEDGSCRDNFHALLLLESQVPDAPGSLAHFYAVASYNLQHPDSMNFRAEALAGLRTTLADALAGRAKIEEMRRRARRGAEAMGRVTRRAGDEVLRWPVDRWPMTVVDVCAGGVAEYAERVVRWAQSICDTLDAVRKP